MQIELHSCMLVYLVLQFLFLIFASHISATYLNPVGVEDIEYINILLFMYS